MGTGETGVGKRLASHHSLFTGHFQEFTIHFQKAKKTPSLWLGAEKRTF